MAGTLVANTINTDTGLFSTNNAYSGIAKAWVQFAGSTGTIAGSFNISSVTRSGAGVYSLSFTTAMPNTNYIATVTPSADSGTYYMTGMSFSTTGGAASSPTTSGFAFITSRTTAVLSDPVIVSVAVFSS